jgi:hypothetical protein
MDGELFSGLFKPVSQLSGCDMLCPETGEKYHKFRLRASDGILLFRANAPEEWLRSQEQVLLQTTALRGDRFVAEAQYFIRRVNGEAPSVRAKQGPRNEWIIERTGEPNVEDLRPFIEALRSNVKAAREGPREPRLVLFIRVVSSPACVRSNPKKLCCFSAVTNRPTNCSGA